MLLESAGNTTGVIIGLHREGHAVQILARCNGRMSVMFGAFMLIAGLGLMAGCAREEAPPPTAVDPAPVVVGEEETAKVEGTLNVFHAASLARPFEEIEKLLEARNPGLDVVRESSSSRLACRKVTELARKADIIATADYTMVQSMLMPEHTDWFVSSARNRVVLAYSDQSKYQSEINTDNWYEILLRDDVEFGYADPGQAPVGYRTLLVWKLADIYYADKKGDVSIFDDLLAACPEKNVRPHCNELIPLVQSLGLDYIFEYQSVARQHNLQFVQLPAEIDLSSEKLGEYYGQAEVEVEGGERGEMITKKGKPVVYGTTILTDAPNRPAALAFMELLLSAEGQGVMEDNFQEPIVPALTPDASKVPAELAAFVAKAEM